MTPTAALAIDLRQYVPDLPERITREELDRMSPEQQASLIARLGAGVQALQQAGFQSAAERDVRLAEAQRVEAEIKREHGVSSVAELDGRLEEATTQCEAAWVEVARLMSEVRAS